MSGTSFQLLLLDQKKHFLILNVNFIFSKGIKTRLRRFKINNNTDQLHIIT